LLIKTINHEKMHGLQETVQMIKSILNTLYPCRDRRSCIRHSRCRLCWASLV